MAMTNYKYRTFSKQTLFSRLHFKTRVEVPRPIVIVGNNEGIPVDSVENKKYLARKVNDHGNVESIISRSESSTGKVIYEVLWQDGTKSQESVECIHNLAYDKFEGYEHNKLDLRRQQNGRTRRIQRKKVVQWAVRDEGNEGTNGDNDHEIQDKENQRPPKKRRRIGTTRSVAVINVDDLKTRTGRFSQIPYYTDPEMIQTHWKHCTKCNEEGFPNGPQDNNNKKRKQRRQQKVDDVFQMSSGEEELLQGRLFLCITCSAVTHEGCIGLGRNGKQHLQHLRRCCSNDRDSQVLMQFQCSHCLTATRGKAEEFPKCDGCHESRSIQGFKFVHWEKELEVPWGVGDDSSIQQKQQSKDSSPEPPESEDAHRLYRCNRCLRVYHDTCLPDYLSKNTNNMVDRKRQIFEEEWRCGECITYNKRVDLILTWRVRGTTEVNDKKTKTDYLEYSKAKPSTREYLIKWVDTPYTCLDWVSDGWLKLIAKQKYKNFCDRQQHMERQTVVEVVPRDYLTIERILTAEDANGNVLTTKSISLVDRVYVKYHGLNYDSIYWDSPPKNSSDLYPSFLTAYEKYLQACRVQPPVHMKQQVSLIRGLATKENYGRHELRQQPDFIRGGTLMPHQLDGLNWLIFQWERAKGCVLADDMGLGKTIQIVTFLNFLLTKYSIYPFLVVVPLSTATNWLREFNKWAPEMVVVPYHGSSEARKRALKHEIFRGGSKTPRCHAIILTYESAMQDNGLFLRLNYWPALVVDEAQRLKNDSSQLFQKLLKNIKYDHPILMTGTPLQNNIRELINVMHFVDRMEFDNIKELEQKYSELSHTTVQELHDQLKPYFLRRTKEIVLKNLPPKTEIIVPVSMSSLQKEVYKGILEQNLTSYAQLGASDQQRTSKVKTTTLRNTLMQLRKTLGHPYIIPDIEIKQKDAATTHQVLIDSCAKLKVLHQMLPKLKQNGHRVLIFSSFKGILDILEDYLIYEQHDYVRVDGDISSNDRVTAIDQYNASDSNLFVFLLTTRAGGVGINLATADTVIMWDFDFNPHADLQAICRAYRIGQTRPVLVLRFMTRLSVEEKIAQIAKKKMVLDHLVVEKMDDDDLKEKDVEGIIKFGAQALFEADDAKRIIYDSAGIDKLLDRATEKTINDNKNGQDTVEQSCSKPMSFSFAKVWVKDKGEATDNLPIDGEEDRPEDEDFFIRYLERKKAQVEAEKQMNVQEQELGRGARKRAFVNYSLDTGRNFGNVQKNKKNNKKNKKRGKNSQEGSDSEGSDFQLENILEAEPEEEFEMDMGMKSDDRGLLVSQSPTSLCAPRSQFNDYNVTHPQFIDNFQSGHLSKNIPHNDSALIQTTCTNFVSSIYGNKIGVQQQPQQSSYQQAHPISARSSHFPLAALHSTKPMAPPQRRPQEAQYYTTDLTNTLLNISEREGTSERSMGKNEAIEGGITGDTNTQPPQAPQAPQAPTLPPPYNGSNDHGNDHGNYTISHSNPQRPAPHLYASATTDQAVPKHSSPITSVNQQSCIPVYTPPPSNRHASQFQHSQLTSSSSQSLRPHLQQPFFIYTQPPPPQQKQIPHSGVPVESRFNLAQPSKTCNQNLPIEHFNNNFHLNNSIAISYNPTPQQNRPIQLSPPRHFIPIEQQRNTHHPDYHLSQNSPVEHQPITPFGTPVQQLQQNQQPQLYPHNPRSPTQYIPGSQPLLPPHFLNQQVPPPDNSPTFSTSTSQNQPSMTQNPHQ